MKGPLNRSRHGQRERSYGALIGVALDPDSSAVSFDNSFRDGEAQTRTVAVGA